MNRETAKALARLRGTRSGKATAMLNIGAIILVAAGVLLALHFMAGHAAHAAHAATACLTTNAGEYHRPSGAGSLRYLETIAFVPTCEG